MSGGTGEPVLDILYLMSGLTSVNKSAYPPWNSSCMIGIIILSGTSRCSRRQSTPVRPVVDCSITRQNRPSCFICVCGAGALDISTSLVLSGLTYTHGKGAGNCLAGPGIW